MKIDGKVFCFFEQSGTFKNEFRKFGIPAEDYDIQNHFGQTDHVCDLFAEIETAYRGGQSVFDEITPDDLVLAFFPCIYFCAVSQMNFSWGCVNYRNLTIKQRTDAILERDKKRAYFYSVLIKMFAVAQERGLRLITENPWSEQTYLKANFILPPSLVDMDRTKRGDYRIKPTAYWYINCQPTNKISYQQTPRNLIKNHDELRQSPQAGLCSEERSMISPDYARNFICDFILGKEQAHTERTLFDI